ncbi:carboxylesterase family protein [Vagococcus luciliae]|uniref:Carboxylic ester hydrolase n=1 Tax=Vagococcus luciliae TaxID=2920380 RepID=A0ABY5NX22_9ENTE|nr:carboxylesterase family protein [Vagococcus luciliae]UUV98191.1 Para-nitrobenzyl esterase [Vagococcus luciliae]
MNVFGFLDFTSFSDNFDSNIGLKDVICGLEWVKENIYEFGGNADNVTLFGQSAGAMLIACLNKVSSAQHLSHKMIIESACIESLFTQQETTAISQKYLDLLGEYQLIR